MRINVFNCEINVSMFNDMFRPTKLDNELWCNHENVSEHAQAPKLVESNLQADISIHLKQSGCQQNRQHIVINRISYHNQNNYQNAASMNETSITSNESRDSEVECKTLVQSSSTSFALLPILDMIYIKPSEAHTGKLFEGSNSSTDKPNNGTNENLTNHSKHNSELGEFFKLNKLGLQLEQTRSSTFKLYSVASEYSKSLVNSNMGRLKINGNDCRNECKNLHERKQAESESCFRLASIEESEELPKRNSESRNTFKNNDTNQVEIKGNNSRVKKRGDNDQKLARRVGKPDREGDVVKVGAEAEQMKIQHLQEHNQQLRRRQQQQIQLHRAEMRCGCRQQVDAITASSSASIAKAAVGATVIETETETETETEAETTTTTTRTGFQVEARSKALRPNQQADKFVVKAANFEHDLADKQRQQVFYCMLHSRLSLSSPSSSSCSSSSVAPFSSLSIQSTPFQCYHRKQTELKSSLFVDSNNLNNKKCENYHLERAKKRSRPNKQQEIASSCKKTAQARGEQSLIKNLSSRKDYQTSSVSLKQKTLDSTTKVRDPSSILWGSKVFYPNNQHNNSESTTQKPQSDLLQKRQSKIEQQQQQQQQRQQPDTYLKRNFAPQESRREQIERPRRKRGPFCVDRFREQIKRQGVAKKWQKDTSCLSAQQQETTTNKLATPNFVQLTNNNGMIFEDNLNNNSSQGVAKKCSPSFYNNNTDDNKGRLQELITHKRSSPSSSSSSSSSSSTTSSSSSSSPSLALSSSSSSTGRYNNWSLNKVTDSQDKRPLLGEGGLLTNRLIAFDRPQSVKSHTFQSRINTTFNPKQRNKLKTITEVNPPNSIPQSSSQHHYQANYRREINMSDQDNSNCEYLATNNLHPLEILDQQTRMCISIYDPLPKPNNNNDNLEETLRKNCASNKHSRNTSLIDKNDEYLTQIAIQSATRRRQFDKGKENSSYEYSQSNHKPRQADHLSSSGDQKAFDADYDDEKHEDEEERLRESFPLELRKPIIDLPMRIMKATVNSNSQQELSDPELDRVGVAPLAASETRDNILIVTIETEGNQTKPLLVNPSWTFEELVENVHRELSSLKEETLENLNSNISRSQSLSKSIPQTTTTTHNKAATKLYEEARELAKILHSNLASSSREYVEGFISPIEHHNNHREPLIDPTAMSLSDRARMVGQVERRDCVGMNEAPCWARIEQQSNENNLKCQQRQKQQPNAKCDLQNEQKFAIMDYNQNRRLQFRVPNEDKHSRVKSDRDDSSVEYQQSGASEPHSSPHLLPPHPHPQPHSRSRPLPASSSSSSPFRSSPDWRQTHLRRSQNRTMYNDRYISNISNLTTSMNIKEKSDGVAVLDGNVAEQTRLAHYLQFEPSCSSNLPLCRQRKCSCITTPNKRPFSYNQNSTINLKRIPDRVMMTKSKDNEKATTSRQNCSSFATENNQKIDYKTSSELGNAFSHVSRQSNKSSSPSFSSHSLQVNSRLNRQDNHSTNDKSSTLIMHPVWQTRNRIAETETPDKQKHSDKDETRNKQEITESTNDQKDPSLEVKQQMTKKQATSRLLSYARTVLASKGEFIKVALLCT